MGIEFLPFILVWMNRAERIEWEMQGVLFSRVYMGLFGWAQDHALCVHVVPYIT